MSDEDDYDFFKLRKQTKTYLSKVFTFNEWDTERVRQVRMVIEGATVFSLARLKVQCAFA